MNGVNVRRIKETRRTTVNSGTVIWSSVATYI